MRTLWRHSQEIPSNTPLCRPEVKVHPWHQSADAGASMRYIQQLLDREQLIHPSPAIAVEQGVAGISEWSFRIIGMESMVLDLADVWY